MFEIGELVKNLFSACPGQIDVAFSFVSFAYVSRRLDGWRLDVGSAPSWAGVVSFAVCPSARARLRFDAVGNRDGGAAAGTSTSGEPVRLRASFRRRLFHGLHHFRSIGECGRAVPEAESLVAGSHRGRLNPVVWPSSHRVAGEIELSRRNRD